MVETNLLPPPSKDSNTAKRQYMELYGSLAVMNTYLKIAVLCLSLVVIGLVIAHVKTVQLFQNFRPPVIRISESGRAEALASTTLEYTPREAEIKYFLIQFVERHYGRIRATVQENYASSFYFLDGRLADALIDANKKSRLIETFMTDQSDEIDIRITSVAIEDLRKPPYKATVEFEMIYYAAATRAEKKREKYTASFVFTLRDRVPNNMIPVNPLGFMITYFREDQAF